MARGASKFLFLFLFFLLILCSSSSSEVDPYQDFKRKFLERVAVVHLDTTQNDQVYPSTRIIVTVNPSPPSPTPVTVPATNPANSTPPVTNPATTFPPPPSVAAPATANSPAVTGGSWCVAKSGASESEIQAGIDYACGIGGADCSKIQVGGNCYNPDSIQNHGSYAFNSYYQKNPVQSSCDFGGAAMVTNVNPSVGSCVFPSSSPIPTTTSSSGATIPGLGSANPLLNTSDPAFGTATVSGESPPGINPNPSSSSSSSSTSTSPSTGSQPFIIGFIIVSSFIITYIYEFPLILDV